MRRHPTPPPCLLSVTEDSPRLPQTSHQEEQEEEEFPALGPVQPAPAAEQEAPAVLNWPGTATVQGPAAAGAAAAAARQASPRKLQCCLACMALYNFPLQACYARYAMCHMYS